MSDRPCNFCNYRKRQREAKKDHKKLRIRDDDGWAKVQQAEISTEDWQDVGVSYMKLPDQCEC